MSVDPLAQPCRNFNILGVARMRDPIDGREKAVLSNFAAGGTGNLILVDPGTGQGETIPLPGDDGAWAVLNLNDETLLVGTCPRFGYLHSLDLRTRQWAAPLRDEREQYIWNLALGSDGLVYGGTWPGGALLRYDPRRHVLDNLGRVSDHPGNMYTRMVYGDAPERLLIACGYAESHLAVWDLATGKASHLGKPGAQVKEVNARFICTETGGALDFYDARTLEPIDQDLSGQLKPQVKLPYEGMGFHIGLDGSRIFATRGQEYYLLDSSCPRDAKEVVLRPIPAERPATRILTIISDERGRIWGSSGFGQTIFRYDPHAGEVWNSQVVCDSGGEVFGMAFAGGKLFMSAYSGGDHIVYDPAQPWDQVGNANPRTLEPVKPALIRPSAKSVIGPDGNFWTGWMAGYGVYGGGLTRVDVGTLAMTCWYDPVPGQTIGGLAADDRYLYFITSANANGLPDHQEPLRFVVFAPDGRIVWQQHFQLGQKLQGVCAVAGRALVAVDSALQVFDPAEMRFEQSIQLGQPCQCMVRWDSDSAAVFCGDEVWRVEPLAGQATRVCDAPEPPSTATVAPDGALYFAAGTNLYRLKA